MHHVQSTFDYIPICEFCSNFTKNIFFWDKTDKSRKIEKSIEVSKTWS